jgi:NADH dehydrogenase
MAPSTKTILVTGAAGEIGSRLCRRLMADGHRVRALVLPDDPFLQRLPAGVDVRTGDITRAESLRGTCDGAEVVFHLAAVLLGENDAAFRAVNVEGTRTLVDAATKAQVGHFVHVSSASVVYPRTTHYSRSKRDGEAVVRAATLPFTIIRPTLVYDRGGGLEFKMYADYVRRFPVVPLIAGGKARKRPVHVDDLLAGFAAVAGNPIAHGKTYNLSGGETVTLRELAELMLAREGLHKPMVSIPAGLCEVVGRAWGLLNHRPLLIEHTLAGMFQDADLDPSEAMRDLGYAPKGVRAGILL